jgi:hypothetical protein
VVGTKGCTSRFLDVNTSPYGIYKVWFSLLDSVSMTSVGPDFSYGARYPYYPVIYG